MSNPLGMANDTAIPLAAGAVAPKFEAQTDTGESLSLASLKGKTVILYFYPKADTPGCTKEACNFRDSSVDFSKHSAVIVGVSPDGRARQSRFKTKYELPFTLLADEDHKIAESYGVWVEKSLYGRKYMGIERTTFVIGKDGKIKKIFPKVKVAEHADEVLDALADLES